MAKKSGDRDMELRADIDQKAREMKYATITGNQRKYRLVN